MERTSVEPSLALQDAGERRRVVRNENEPENRAVRSGPQDRKWTENRTELDQLGLDRRSWSFQFHQRTNEKPVHLDRFRPVKDRTEVLVL